MQTRVGTGFSNEINSYQAGRQAAVRAIDSGSLQTCNFAILFCGSKHKATEVLSGVRSITQNAAIIGGSSVGIITADDLAYEGYEVGVAVFQSEEIEFLVYKQDLSKSDEWSSGNELAKMIDSSSNGDIQALLVFYDSFKNFNPPMLNYATYIFKGLEDGVKNLPVTAGAGLFPDLTFISPCYQFHNDQVLQNHIVAVGFKGNIKMNTTIIHGCKPMSSYKTITRAEGPVIYEIDYKPALEAVSEILGPDSGLEWNDYALFLTLGLNRGENKFGEYKETDYASRLVLSVDIEKKALVMFEPDLKSGDEVQLMRRSVDLNYIRVSVENERRKLEVRKPVFAFYIDCLGRAQRFCGSMFEEGTEIQKTVGTSYPLLGFYSGVEVAKVGQNLQALDWTAVLCLFTQ